MHVSRFCAVLLTVICFVALLMPCDVAEGKIYTKFAANNREDILLQLDASLQQKSVDEGTGTIQDIALSPDGKTFAYSTWNADAPGTLDEVGYLVLCETKSGRVLWKTKAHISGVWCLAFSPDGKRLATGSSDEHAKLWDAATGKLLFDLTDHTHAVHDVEFSPDGSILATCSGDGSVRLWDCATGKGLASYVPAQDQDIYCVAFTPDGKQLISTYFNKKLCVWNIAEKRIDANYELPDNASTIVVSRDGRRVACLYSKSYDESAVFVWNLETGKLDPVFGEKFKSSVDDIATVSKDTKDFDLMLLDTDRNIFGCDLSTGKTTNINSPVE